MKLGKALATGVAEERPQVQAREPEDLELPEEIGEIVEIGAVEEVEEVKGPKVRGEVPAVR